ncbi:XdhC family protein [Litoribrevibacter euphylliae]|uniref:XdhC family protein n=1 Tax=Litoribrevibacter euphylliae TaxID=1834034 RepID=A0ABV7HBB4_9GAMM
MLQCVANQTGLNQKDAETPLANSEASLGSSSFVDDVRPYLFSWLDQGLKTALLTLINVEGSSPRGVGSQMLVNQNGESVGLLSGGCVEAALVSEALETLDHHQWKLIRYGRDSDYFDIQLPCGSGIDVLITPIEPSDWVSELARLTEQRQPVALNLDLSEQSFSLSPVSEDDYYPKNHRGSQFTRAQVESDLTSFSKVFLPKHRILAVGQGAVFDFFTVLSQSFDVELFACSSRFTDDELTPIDRNGVDSTGVDRNGVLHTQYLSMKSPKSFDASLLDPFSTLVLLSHDHDWDIPILKAALKTQVAHIAALGSKSTHQQRLALLDMDGVSVEDQTRVKGPAGIDIGGKTPPEIALSVLSEIVAMKNHRHLS